MAVLIVPNLELADEIFATPDFDPCPEPVKLGTPLELADGRFAYCHPWAEVVVDWLSAYVADVTGAEVIEGELPYPVKEVETV